MLSRGSPLTPARIPPFQLPANGQRPRSASRGLQPSDGGPGLLHVPTVTTAHGFQVLAQKPQVLSAEAPLWGTSPETPADPSWSLDQPEIPGTPPHGRFQNFLKVDRILILLTTRKLRSREVDQRILGPQWAASSTICPHTPPVFGSPSRGCRKSAIHSPWSPHSTPEHQ